VPACFIAIEEAIKDGMRTPAMKDELVSLENRKLELANSVAAAPAKAVRLRPNLAQIYRDKVARPHEELNRRELREEASAAIRSLIEEVRLGTRLCADHAILYGLYGRGDIDNCEGGKAHVADTREIDASL
jgi:hypothetical protein